MPVRERRVTLTSRLRICMYKINLTVVYVYIGQVEEEKTIQNESLYVKIVFFFFSIKIGFSVVRNSVKQFLFALTLNL